MKCAQCGYDLSGVAVGESLGQCPECGATFDPERPLPVRPWPRLWKMGVPLCGGMVLLMALDAAGLLARKSGWDAGASILNTVLSMCWAPVFLGGPILGAWWLSHRHAHPSERWMTLLGLTVAGLAASTVLGLAWLMLRTLLA